MGVVEECEECEDRSVGENGGDQLIARGRRESLSKDLPDRNDIEPQRNAARDGVGVADLELPGGKRGESISPYAQ